MRMSMKRFFAYFLISLITLSVLYPLISNVSAPEQAQVYVIVCIDTEADNNHPMTTNLHEAFYVNSYLSSGIIERLFDPVFRNSHVDSMGKPFKLSWFMEIDRYIEQGIFYPSSENVSGYTALLQLMLRYWQSQIDFYGDELAYHHHFMDYRSGRWERVTDLTGYAYHYDALDRMILDHNFYPSSFRSGWLWENNELSAWLEQYFPFDYNAPFDYSREWWSSWAPYHPSSTNFKSPGDMKRWVAKSVPFDGLDQSLTNEAFQMAANGTAAVLSVFGHNWNNLISAINDLQSKLQTAANAYGIPFKYCSAREAIQKFAGITDFSPPQLSIIESGTVYIIKSNETLWNNNVYVALKYVDGTYHHVIPSYSGNNAWILDASMMPEIEQIGVGASDSNGNPTATTLNLSPNIVLKEGTAGSSLINEDGSGANITISAPVETITETYYAQPISGKYDYKRKITITEPGAQARTNEPFEVFLTFDKGTCYSQDSIRVAYWDESWVEIPSQTYNTTFWEDNTLKSATILWNINMELGESKDYYILYDKHGEIQPPNYTGLLTPTVSNRGTPFNMATPCGTGDTIKIKGLYQQTEKDLAWINLKEPNSYVAWDDWYISPGIFHLWVDGEDVFQAGALTGEANTGPVCEHSNGVNYARKGSASSVIFEVVGPLLIKIRVVYPSQNPGYGSTISGNFTDIYSIYYTPDFKVTRVKVEQKQEFPSAFTEAGWGDWAHLDFPAWDIAPVQNKLAYQRSSGIYTEPLTPTAVQGTQHSDWTERWTAMFNDASVKPALGLIFISDSRHSITPNYYRIMNVGGQGTIWGTHWFPSWSIGASISGVYNYQFWWIATKTNTPDTIRNEYLKTTNPLSIIVGSATPNIGSLGSGSTTNVASLESYFCTTESQITSENPSWYNFAFDFRRKVTITESNVYARVYEPVEVFLTFDHGTCYSKDSIRVAYWNESWVEVPSQVYNTTLWPDNTLKSTTILWTANVGLNESKDYYIYYDKDGEVPPPNYTGLSLPKVENRGTSFNLATAYGTGDTIKLRGVYQGVEKDLAWVNLKIPSSHVAWDDWYISPGIFHLWVDGEDVFQGGAFTGEANTGPVCEHSDGANYARKGSATSVTFEVVGSLLIRIRVVYPSQNPGYGNTIPGTFTDIYSVYYTPDFKVTRIKVEQKQEFSSAFTEASWGDWAHLDFPAWDITPTQNKLAYRRSSGTYTESLTPTAFLGTQHSDWTERWIAMFNDASIKPALGLFFTRDDRHTITTNNYRIMNVGGSGSIWGIHWFPSWSIASSISGTYNYQFWWITTKTNTAETIRNEYLKTMSPISITLGNIETAVEPTKYSLTIESTPISAVEFLLDGTPHLTPFNGVLYEGEHILTMPENLTADGIKYDFKQWTDRYTNRTRTVNLNQNLTFTAEFEPHYEVVTVKSEYLFSNITPNTPSQFNFTIEIQHSTDTVNVTIQIYNYANASYATGGQGYLTFISSTTPYVNETRSLVITIDPQFYVSNGNAKVKIVSSKYMIGSFEQKVNMVKLEHSYGVFNYDYVLKVVNPSGKADKNARLRVFDGSNVNRLESLTISFYDGTVSDQITISNGTISQSEGTLFDLPNGTTLYIKITNVQANAPGTSYIYINLEVSIPNTTKSKVYTIILKID
jgi:hypothetical protein